ncbi:low molecular weight phosphatase family protein, partial [Streptococcus agalactiae]
VLMKPGLELPAEPGGTVLEWSFPDPNSWSPEDVRPMRDAVAERIERELLQP